MAVLRGDDMMVAEEVHSPISYFFLFERFSWFSNEFTLSCSIYNRRAPVYCSSEIQSTVNSTWREFICGMPNRRLRNDTGDPLICDGLQYGIISHSYRTGTRAAETGSTDQVRFLVIDYHRGWIDDVIAADDRLCTSDGSPHTSAGLAVVVVFQSVQFLWSRRG